MAQTLETTAPTKGMKFRMAVVGPIRTLDPAYAQSRAEQILISNLGEALMTLDAKTGLPMESAARSANVSKDGLTVTIKLRNDLYWSNGEKIQAADYEYSLRRLVDPTIRSWFFPFLKNIRGAQEFYDGAFIEPGRVGIESADDRTLVIHLAKPDPFLLISLAHSATIPVHRKTLDRHKQAWFLPRNWVGSGPFLPRAKNPRFYRLRKNPHHRLSPSIAVNEVEVFLSPTRADATDLFIQGKVDQFGYRDHGVPPHQLAKIQAGKGLRYEPDLHTFVLRMNMTKAPLSQRKVREALAMSIDRHLLVPRAAQIRQPITFSLLPKGILGYEPPPGYLLNVPGALGILSDLGYCTRDRDVVGCSSFPPLELIHRDHSSMRKLALTLQGLWSRSLGIQGIRLKALQDEAFDRAIQTGEYTLALDDLAVDPERPFDFLKLYHSSQKSSGGFSHPEFDHLLDFAQGTANWVEARVHFRAAEAKLLREAVVVPLYHSTTPILVSPKLKGFVPNILGIYSFGDLSLGL